MYTERKCNEKGFLGYASVVSCPESIISVKLCALAHFTSPTSENLSSHKHVGHVLIKTHYVSSPSRLTLLAELCTSCQGVGKRARIDASRSLGCDNCGNAGSCQIQRGSEHGERSPDIRSENFDAHEEVGQSSAALWFSVAFNSHH